ncbi:SDR family NAD(P)-dependent oxidoreductase, partial [Salmonella sp. s54925]|uniref:SDR family NAD(P)-dependent oxidoreductase n=1 Tax=Salmonella sp. s54925 TaxID=3159674 RepID=UPI00397F1155
DKSMLVNVKVPFRLSQAIARNIIKKGSTGAIVNVSSISSDVGANRFCPYGITKSALDNVTMSLAVELAPHKIRVNSILPGLTNTPLVQSISGSE